MNWRKWKIGLAVAMLTGILSGFLGLAIGLTWPQVWILLAASLAKDTLLYLKSNPVDQITFETTFTRKNESTGEIITQSSKSTTPIQPITDDSK